MTSSSVIEFLTSMFDRYGLVEEIVTDNGSQFTSVEFTDFLTKLAIKHTKVSLYSPQSNAAVERFNRVMKDGLRAGLAEGHPFMTAVRHTLAAYRTTPHATTGVTPASLFLAFQVRTPLTSLKQSLTSSPPEHPVVATKVKFAQEKMAAHYDQKHRVKAGTVKAGDKVRILLPVRAHKLAPKFSEPITVKKAVENTVWLENGQKWNLRRILLHKSSLRSETSSAAATTPPSSECPVPEPIDDDDEEPHFPFPLAAPMPANRGLAVAAPAPVVPVRCSTRMRRPNVFGPDWSK